PTTMLSASPPKARPSETPRCRESSPDATRSAIAAHTDENAGSTCVRIAPLRVAASDAASTRAMGAAAESACHALAPTARARLALPPVVTRRSVVLEDFFAHVEPHAVAPT